MDRFSETSTGQINIVDIKIADVCSEQFQSYGQLIAAQDDGVPYSEKDANIDLTQGIPRVYIMRINRPILQRYFLPKLFHNDERCPALLVRLQAH